MVTIYPTRVGANNTLVRLSDEQLMSLLAAGVSAREDDVQIRAVVKSNKIIGLKIVKKGKNEVIKCSWMNESNLKVCLQGDKGDDAVELGDVNGRISLINYKPAVTDNMVDLVKERRSLKDVVEFVVGSGEMVDDGVRFDEKDAVRKFGESLVQKIRAYENIMDYKWVKLVKCDDKVWRELLVKEGYSDEMDGGVWQMLYSGIVERKENTRDDDGHVKGLILEYQKVYVEYYELYYNIESNFGIKKLIGMHNKLEELKSQIELEAERGEST